jgi:hypothetical protein
MWQVQLITIESVFTLLLPCAKFVYNSIHRQQHFFNHVCFSQAFSFADVFAVEE